MDYGVCIYGILWTLYDILFPFSAYGAIITPFGYIIALHNIDICCVYDGMRCCWPWVIVGQLAFQYPDIGVANVDTVRVGNDVFAPFLQGSV